MPGPGESPKSNNLPSLFPLTVHPSVCIHIAMETRVFKNGNSLAVRLPKGLELPCGRVSIRRDGRKLVIEEVTATGWPRDFFESVRISRKDFGREPATYREKAL